MQDEGLCQREEADQDVAEEVDVRPRAYGWPEVQQLRIFKIILGTDEPRVPNPKPLAHHGMFIATSCMACTTTCKGSQGTNGCAVATHLRRWR